MKSIIGTLAWLGALGSPGEKLWFPFTGNRLNGGPPRHNKSGYRGVSWCKQTAKWSASIRLAGRSNRLGRFSNIEDAVAARKSAEDAFWKEVAS